MTLSDLLDALDAALLKRERYWRHLKDDPHGIATPVMVALGEVRSAIEEVIEEDEKSLRALKKIAKRHSGEPEKTARKD